MNKSQISQETIHKNKDLNIKSALEINIANVGSVDAVFMGRKIAGGTVLPTISFQGTACDTEDAEISFDKNHPDYGQVGAQELHVIIIKVTQLCGCH